MTLPAITALRGALLGPYPELKAAAEKLIKAAQKGAESKGAIVERLGVTRRAWNKLEQERAR